MMERYGEKMIRRFPGLYDGQDVRTERVFGGSSWKFEMRCNELRPGWYEFAPTGYWTSIGTWPTLERGLFVASLLRAGSHFYDRCHGGRARLYNEEVYAQLRESANV